jgi:HEAT repeat protein
VARALDPLLNDDKTRESGVLALERWADKDNVPSLIKMLDNMNGIIWNSAMRTLGRLQDERAAAPLAKQLTTFGRNHQAANALRALGRVAEKEVLKYLHHKDFFARTAVPGLLRGYGTTDAAILDQTVTDLESAEDQTRQLAADDLARRPLDAGKQGQVARALGGLLVDKIPAVRQAGMSALGKWATKDNVPALVTALQDAGLRAQAITLLGKLKDERAALPLAVLLPTPDRPRVGRALREIGPMAQSAVITVLKATPDVAARKEAWHILGAVGTRASLPVLAQLARADRANMNDARNAIKQIQTRK